MTFDDKRIDKYFDVFSVSRWLDRGYWSSTRCRSRSKEFKFFPNDLHRFFHCSAPAIQKRMFFSQITKWFGMERRNSKKQQQNNGNNGKAKYSSKNDAKRKELNCVFFIGRFLLLLFLQSIDVTILINYYAGFANFNKPNTHDERPIQISECASNRSSVCKWKYNFVLHNSSQCK